MCKGKSKRKLKVLNQYAAVIKRERTKATAKAEKQKKARRAKAQESSPEESSESDNDHSVNIVEQVPKVTDNCAEMKSALKKVIAKNYHKQIIAPKHKQVTFPKGKKVLTKLKKKHQPCQVVLEKKEKAEEEAYQKRIANLGQVNEEILAISDN